MIKEERYFLINELLRPQLTKLEVGIIKPKEYIIELASNDRSIVDLADECGDKRDNPYVRTVCLK